MNFCGWMTRRSQALPFSRKAQDACLFLRVVRLEVDDGQKQKEA